MCRACRYLYPEEYKKSLRQLRTRRASTYAVQTSANFEDDLNKAYSDLHTKESVASRTKTIQLKFDDYKEVNYLQDLLVDKDVKGPEGSIEEFTFDEAEYPIMKIGDRPFEAYNPPVPSLNDQIISRFSAYFDLFAPSTTQITDRPKWTLEGALEYMHAHQASQPAPDTEVTTTLEVLSSTSTTQPRSIIDADIVSLLVSNDSASDSFLHENAKTYKTSGTGLPNALLVTPTSVIVGMSKSQVLFFPNRASDSPSPFFATPTSPSDSLPSSAPFVHGSPENCADIGSVLSLGADASGGVCAIGYSSGAIDVLSVDRHTLLKSFASVHATAVVFVRVLSNESILSADYDGNVNVTSYTRKLFSAAVNSVRVFQAAQFGQHTEPLQMDDPRGGKDAPQRGRIPAAKARQKVSAVCTGMVQVVLLYRLGDAVLHSKNGPAHGQGGGQQGIAVGREQDDAGKREGKIVRTQSRSASWCIDCFAAVHGGAAECNQGNTKRTGRQPKKEIQR